MKNVWSIFRKILWDATFKFDLIINTSLVKFTILILYTCPHTIYAKSQLEHFVLFLALNKQLYNIVKEDWHVKFKQLIIEK